MAKKEKETTPVYKAFLRDLAQVIIGELVEETDEVIRLKKPSLMGVTPQQNNSVSLQFIPMELANMQPPISFKLFLEKAEDMDDAVFTFNKNQILVDNLDLKSDIYNGYAESHKPKPQIAVPENLGGLVGPDGNPIDPSAPPVAQNLFDD